MTVTDTTTLAAIPERYFAAWHSKDLADIDALLAEDFEWIDPLLPDVVDNIEGAHMFMESSWEGFPDIRFESLGAPLVDEATGRVAAEWRMVMTHTGEFSGIEATGNTVDINGTDVFTVDADGRVTAIHAYYNAGGVLGQLGLLD